MDTSLDLMASVCLDLMVNQSRLPREVLMDLDVDHMLAPTVLFMDLTESLFSDPMVSHSRLDSTQTVL